MASYVIFASLLTVQHLGSLYNIFRGDVRVSLDGLYAIWSEMKNPSHKRLTQSQAMVVPGSKVFGTVYSNTATFRLLLGLVLSKPVETTSLLLYAKTAGVGVKDVAVRIEPTSAGNDPFSTGDGGETQEGSKTSNGHGKDQLASPSSN
jgi:hypothetical protein